MKFVFSLLFLFLNVLFFIFFINFLQKWWNIYNYFVDYIFFNNFNNNNSYFKNNIGNNLDNIVFIWIDEKFLNKSYKDEYDVSNYDYNLFLQKIDHFKPKNIIISNLNLWLVSKDYKNILNTINNPYINNIYNNYITLKKTLLSLDSNVIIWYDNNKNLNAIFKNENIDLWYNNFSINQIWFSDGFNVTESTNNVPLWYKLFLKENKINNFSTFVSWWYYNIKDNDKGIIVRKIPLIDWKTIKFPLLLKENDVNYYSIYDIINNEKLWEKIKWKNVFLWYNIDKFNLNSYIGKLPESMYHINSYFSIKNNFYYNSINKNNINYYLLLIIWISIFLFFLYKDIKFSLWFTFFSILFSIFLYYILLVKWWYFFPLWKILIVLFIKLFLDFVFWLFSWYIKRREITNLFDKYVWKNVLEKKQSSIKWTSDNKNVFILFSDIESFTSISEKLSPEQVIKMLNIYFYHLWREIEKSWWFIDKYIWDSIMAFWEDVKYSDNILNVMLNMEKTHEKINEEIHEKIDKNINLKTRIWLHYGNVLVWDVWNASWKISYTIIWDNVNLASRLEWINKFYNTSMVFSQYVLDTIKHSANYTYRLIDKISVKWKKEWVKIYQLIWKNDVYSKFYIREFEKWIYYYISWNFESAYTIFLKLISSNEGYKDKVLKVMFSKVKYLKENPPKIWEWIRRYNEK